MDRTRRGDAGAEELRWDLATIEGNPFVSARIWFRDRDGRWLPTKRGITVRVRELDDVIEALQAAARIVEAQRPREPRRRATSRPAEGPTPEYRTGFDEF